MMRALFTAVTGLNAHKLNVDVIANNLANVNTCGFKRQKAEFQDLIYEEVCPATDASIVGVERPVPTEFGSGVKLAATTRVFTQGSLKQTGRSLDTAIQGEGFYRVKLPDNRIAYTRNGEFHVNSQGQLTTVDGLLVDPGVTFSNVDITSIAMAPDGTIMATPRNNPEVRETVGRFQLAVFQNPEGLKAIGSNLFIETPASGRPTDTNPGENGAGELACGFCEQSNVNVVGELVDMIIAQRAYEVNSRAIRTSDEMLSIANQLIR